MRQPVFVDTSCVLALVNTAEKRHAAAQTIARQLEPPFLTTEAVLVEVGNARSRSRFRLLAVTTISQMVVDPNLEVVSVTPQLFSQALTTDRHFTQAGFHNLLPVSP